MAAGESLLSETRLGFIKDQATIATKFIPAARTKKALALPVWRLWRSGNMMALSAAPMLPTMFIEPETAPELTPPISLQKAQLGLNVISTPNVARLNQKTNR